MIGWTLAPGIWRRELFGPFVDPLDVERQGRQRRGDGFADVAGAEQQDAGQAGGGCLFLGFDAGEDGGVRPLQPEGDVTAAALADGGA